MKNNIHKIEVEASTKGATIVGQIIESCGGVAKVIYRNTEYVKLLAEFSDEPHLKFCKHLLIKRHSQVVKLNDILFKDEKIESSMPRINRAEIDVILKRINDST